MANLLKDVFTLLQQDRRWARSGPQFGDGNAESDLMAVLLHLSAAFADFLLGA